MNDKSAPELHRHNGLGFVLPAVSRELLMTVHMNQSDKFAEKDSGL